MPSRLYPWALLVAMQVLIPGVSFLGHLGGILVGDLELRGFLDVLLPSPAARWFSRTFSFPTQWSISVQVARGRGILGLALFALGRLAAARGGVEIGSWLAGVDSRGGRAERVLRVPRRVLLLDARRGPTLVSGTRIRNAASPA